MSEAAVSRGGWHAQHLRHGDAVAGQRASSNTRSDRKRLLKEAMRALEESDMARQAARNPSIVAADTHLNTAFVNDGEGGFRELSAAEGVEPVLEYGDGRINAVKRKWHPKSFETTTIVSWVPKSLLKEVPDYYPVYDKSGTEIGRRSRWVMPDDEAGKAEVDRWFRETHAHLTEDVLTGGHDAVHGVVWNFDESVPHVHWMCDTLAPLQKDLSVGEHGIMLDRSGNEVVKYKKAVTVGDVVDVTQDLDGTWRVTSAPEIEVAQIGAIDRHGYLVGADGERLTASTGRPVRASQDLKVEAQQMWGQSSEVTETRMVDGVEKRVKITGATKMSRYQEQYREHLIERGFDIELEVNPEGTSLDKKAFGASEAEKLAVATEAEELAAERAELDRRVEYVAAQMERLDARAAEIDGKEAEARQQAETIVVEARTKAAAIEAEAKRREESGYSAGYQAGSTEGRAAWERDEKPGVTQAAREEGLKQGRAEVTAELEAARQKHEEAAETLRETAGLTPEEATGRVVDEYTVKAQKVLQHYPVKKVKYDEKGKAHLVTGADGKPEITNAWEQMQTDVARLGGEDVTIGQNRREGQEMRKAVRAKAGQVRERGAGEAREKGFGQ